MAGRDKAHDFMKISSPGKAYLDGARGSVGVSPNR